MGENKLLFDQMMIVSVLYETVFCASSLKQQFTDRYIASHYLDLQPISLRSYPLMKLAKQRRNK